MIQNFLRRFIKDVRLVSLLALSITISGCAQTQTSVPSEQKYYSDSAVEQLKQQWHSIPTMRMGMNYYLQYSPDYVSENDTSSHEKLYWGISYNAVNGVNECDVYGVGYAVPEPYMSQMTKLAISNNEIKTISENIFGKDAYGLDFFIREVDSKDGLIYCYRKDDDGYYRFIEPLDEYDQLTTLRPEYIENLRSVSKYELKGQYTGTDGIVWNATISLNETVPVPKTMQLTYDQPLYNDGLKVDWLKCDYVFYDYDSELLMTDDIYKEASERFSASVSSPDIEDIAGNYYFMRYYQEYEEGQEVIVPTGDSYYKYSDTYYFSIPSDATLNCIFTVPKESSISVDNLVCLDSHDLIHAVWEEDGMWKTSMEVTGDVEFQFVQIENNVETTFTYTGNYTLERVVGNVPGAIPTTISQNYLEGTQINYLGQNIIIQEQSLLPDGQGSDITVPISSNQTITYNSKSSGDVALASIQFARKLADLDSISSNVLSEYLNHYKHDPKYVVEDEVLEFFDYVRPITDYLFSVYDITTYNLEKSDVIEDYRFYGFSTDRSTCISLGIVYNTEDYSPTVLYTITQIYDFK